MDTLKYFEQYLNLIDNDISKLNEIKNEIIKQYPALQQIDSTHLNQVKNTIIENNSNNDYIKSNNITELLLSLKVRPSLKGFNYLATAISLIYDDPEYLDLITKILYPKIASIHCTTPSRVERAIRHAIECSFQSLSNEVKQNVFYRNNEKGKPTNAEYIAYVYKYFLLQSKQVKDKQNILK